MSKDPAFPFYARDWLVATRTMSPAARGAYIDLLCHQWIEGTVPAERLGLRRVCAMDAEDFDRVWPEIEQQFSMNCSGLINPRLEEVRNERLSFVEKQRINGMKGGRPKTQGITQTKPKPNPSPNPKITSASASSISLSSPDTTYPTKTSHGDVCDFESFWSHYPKREGPNPKKTARVAYEKALKSAAPADILSGLDAYVQANRDQVGTRFFPMATTWLNQERWGDAPKPVAREYLWDEDRQRWYFLNDEREINLMPRTWRPKNADVA